MKTHNWKPILAIGALMCMGMEACCTPQVTNHAHHTGKHAIQQAPREELQPLNACNLASIEEELASQGRAIQTLKQRSDVALVLACVLVGVPLTATLLLYYLGLQE